QSAGGGAVQTLLAAPAARGLFRAAISASGAVMRPQDRAAAEAVTRAFAARTGVPATAAALRDATDAELLAHQDALAESDDLPPLHLAPFADGEVVPVPVPEALADAEVPLLLGFTADEFAAPAGQEPPPSEAELRGLLGAFGLDEARAARFLAERPGADGRAAITDWLFRAPALAVAEARAERRRPTWLYQFDWSGSAPGRAGQAYHCTDLPFAFDLLGAEGVDAALGAEPPQALADAVHAAWTAFVRDLDPGAGWPRTATAGPPCAGRPSPGRSATRCAPSARSGCPDAPSAPVRRGRGPTARGRATRGSSRRSCTGGRSGSRAG
ncbi:carboxylesterase family protein, partial [Kitasatospora cheerisanensis]|uniref:carboxylesterase family protein n=1 Tax=Kitasatospora cheerisanensis TaxID=81942 RepID=UPI001431549F